MAGFARPHVKLGTEGARHGHLATAPLRFEHCRGTTAASKFLLRFGMSQLDLLLEDAHLGPRPAQTSFSLQASPNGMAKDYYRLRICRQVFFR